MGHACRRSPPPLLVEARSGQREARCGDVLLALGVLSSGQRRPQGMNLLRLVIYIHLQIFTVHVHYPPVNSP